MSKPYGNKVWNPGKGTHYNAQPFEIRRRCDDDGMDGCSRYRITARVLSHNRAKYHQRTSQFGHTLYACTGVLKNARVSRNIGSPLRLCREAETVKR